ncbi:MAG: M23 family metallopeptidase [Nitrospiraceae bacterium]|nr:MAG: M23 family metallopeptidase [Nitrospiraceae bacterium]
MKRFNLENKQINGFSRIGLILVLSFSAVAAGWLGYQMFFVPGPVINGTEAFNSLSADKTITLQGENPGVIDIIVTQDGKSVSLLHDTPGRGLKSYTLQIRTKELGLTDGAAIIIVKAKTGVFKETKYEINSSIDTVPPQLEVLSATESIDMGGAGFALLRASGADSVFVKLEDGLFPAFRVSDSQTKTVQSADGAYYYVFFPAPFNAKSDSVFYAVARDAAGNQGMKSVSTKIKATRFKSSSLNIDDIFIDKVIAPLLNDANISDREGSFKKVNEDMREKNHEKLIDIAQKTEPKILWEGPFLQMKNSKVMATYGDERTYMYKGNAVSGSVHLGYDLASIAHSPVEAANSGIVRFADDLGIYGNTVVIDHGLGLMSLYGHLSTIMVKEGQTVNKGEVIAKTGSTGLAGGDHLHFGILVHGHEVSPLYWWDPHWIKVNVSDHLAANS